MKSDLQGEGHAVYFQVDQGKKKKNPSLYIQKKSQSKYGQKISTK